MTKLSNHVKFRCNPSRIKKALGFFRLRRNNNKNNKNNKMGLVLRSRFSGPKNITILWHFFWFSFDAQLQTWDIIPLRIGFSTASWFLPSNFDFSETATS